jgi:hypothetical protein
MKSLVLKDKKEFFVFPSSPFHFDGTFHKPSYYPDKLTDWEDGKYWQTIRIGKRLFGLKIENKGETQKPKIKVSVFYDDKISDGELEKIRQEIIWRFARVEIFLSLISLISRYCRVPKLLSTLPLASGEWAKIGSISSSLKSLSN